MITNIDNKTTLTITEKDIYSVNSVTKELKFFALSTYIGLNTFPDKKSVIIPYGTKPLLFELIRANETFNITITGTIETRNHRILYVKSVDTFIDNSATNLIPKDEVIVFDEFDISLLQFNESPNDKSNLINIVDPSLVIYNTGKSGSSINFAGRNTPITPISLSEEFTMSLWIKLYSVASQTIISNNNGLYFLFFHSNVLYIRDSGLNYTGFYFDGNINNFTHICIVRKSKFVFELYIDNVLQSPTVTEGNLGTLELNMQGFGAFQIGSYPFYGDIDQLRYATKARTTAQVTTLFQEI